MPHLYPQTDYSLLRQQAYDSTLAQLRDPAIRIGHISGLDLVMADKWPTEFYLYGKTALTWFDIYQMYARQYVRRFEVSIGYGGILCGLSIGRPSKRKTQMGIDLIQGNPDDTHPLKGRVVALTMLTAMEYGRAIGAIDLRLYNPVPELIGYYQRFGFAFVNKGMGGRGNSYMTMPIT